MQYSFQQQYLIQAHNVNLKTIKGLYHKVNANPDFKTIRNLRRAIDFQMRLHTYIIELFGKNFLVRMTLDEELAKLMDIGSILELIEENVRASTDMTDEFYREQRQRLREKLNCLIIVTGPQGYGKTMLGRNISQRMDKTFKMSEDLFFLGTEFLPKIRESGRGKYVVFDEPVVELGSRRSMEKGRPEINAVFTVFRMKQISVVLCTPFVDDVDRADRRLVWALIEVVTKGIGLWYSIPHGKDPKDLSNWELKGRIYFDNLEDAEWEAYEKRKGDFIDKVVRRAETRLAERTGKPVVDRRKVVQQVFEKCKRWLEENNISDPKYADIHEFLLIEGSDAEFEIFKDANNEKVLLNRITRERTQVSQDLKAGNPKTKLQKGRLNGVRKR